MAGGVGVEIVSYGSFTAGFTIVEGSGIALITDGLARATREAQNFHPPKWSDKHETDFLFNQAIKNPPRFNGKDLGFDPTQCPEKGFEWKGKGSPESGKGNWINPNTGEKLHPDLWHKDPKGPRWGCKDSNGTSYDLYPDGSWQ